MAYEKQTWECGDVITADKMNHMEDGIANAGGGDTDAFVINVSRDTDKPWIFVSDKTYNEIDTAYGEGKQLEVVFNNETYSFRGREESLATREYRFTSGLSVPSFFSETETSTTAWVSCIIISTDAVKRYEKGVTLTFS